MVQSAADTVTLTREPLYVRGIELYCAGEFFTCHEVLEELWTPMRGPHRLFLQALIHFAVAFYHQQRHNPLGAERQLRKALRKIERYLPMYEGVDTATLHREGLESLRRIQAGEVAGPPRMLLERFVDSSLSHGSE
jgi:predicted metal-dependent hydrolase